MCLKDAVPGSCQQCQLKSSSFNKVSSSFGLLPIYFEEFLPAKNAPKIHLCFMQPTCSFVEWTPTVMNNMINCQANTGSSPAHTYCHMWEYHCRASVLLQGAGHSSSALPTDLPEL